MLSILIVFRLSELIIILLEFTYITKNVLSKRFRTRNTDLNIVELAFFVDYI